jgi:[acyl-carrier-protein] S-malonyltransferase
MGEPWRQTEHWQVVKRLSEGCGRDVAGLLLDTDAATLARTENAQLATFALEMVILSALREALPQLNVVVCAGHSLGEYGALTAAGVLQLEDAGRLVAERGAAMAAAARHTPGTMAVLIGPGIARTAETLAARLRADRRGRVWVANRNSPEQVVISGAVPAVDALAEEVASGGARVLRIPVGGAFHTPLMAPARPGLAAALDRTPFHPASCPVVANVNGRAYRRDHENWRRLVLHQLVRPVHWEGSVRTMLSMARTSPLHLVELGPGRVLTGLARRIHPDTPARSVATPAQLEALAAAWWA